MTAPRLNWASLVWETRGYLGLDEDAPIPVDELRETAMANGWSEREVKEALRETDEVVPTSDDPTGNVQLIEKPSNVREEASDSPPRGPAASTGKNVLSGYAGVDWTSIEHRVDPAGVDEYAAWMPAVDKRPWTPNAPTENRRSWSDPANWISAEETRQWLAMHPEIDGRAFILQSERGNYDGKPDPYLFVDYDSVLDEDGEPAPEAVALMDRLGLTYTDISSSWTGAHQIFRGELPEGTRTIQFELPNGAGEVEIYDQRRVCIMTGRHVADTPVDPQPVDADVLEKLADEHGRSASSVEREDWEPEYDREDLRGMDTTDDIQAVFDAIQQVEPRDIRLRSSLTEERPDGTLSFDPSWEASTSGKRLGWDPDIGFIYRQGDRGLDALHVVALEEGISRSVDRYPRGEDWWTAVDALRDRGARIPEYESTSSRGEGRNGDLPPLLEAALDAGDDVEAQPVSSLPLEALEHLDHAERRRYARKRGLEWPSTREARDQLFATISQVMRHEDVAVVDAPTSLGKSHTVATTSWTSEEQLREISGGKEVIHLQATRDARDEAVEAAEEAGVDYFVLQARHEACPVAAGDYDPAATDDASAELDYEPLTIGGMGASEWLEMMCDGRGIPFSVAHEYLNGNNDQGRDLPCCSGETTYDEEEGDFDETPSVCPAISQWESLRDRRDAGEIDLVFATHNFAHVPGLRMGTNIVVDEEPDFVQDLSTDRIRKAVAGYLQAIDAPVTTWEAFIQLSLHEGWGDDAANEREALQDAINEDPDREWFFEDSRAHTLAPALARAIFNAEERSNGRRVGKTPYDPPRLDAAVVDDDAWNRSWVTVVLDESNDVRTVRSAPDFSLARSVVGLDAHPARPRWMVNVHPSIQTKSVLDPEQRRLWRRFERGLRVVQVGDATRPLASGEYFTPEQVRTLVDHLVDEYGHRFRTAITTNAVEQRLLKLMEEAGCVQPDTMHYGEEKSRNDFANEQVGLVNGCIDPGDDFVVDLLAELDLEAEPETTVDGDGVEHRAHGRGFVGDDAGVAAEILASVRENHTAQAAGRYARSPDDPDSSATVFVRTDAMPTGFADVQVPGVEWVFSDKQRAIVEELRNSHGRQSAAKIADAVGCSKEHVRTTLRRLADRDDSPAVQAYTGAGEHGATLYADSGTPNNGMVDVGTANHDVSGPYTWALAIRDPVVDKTAPADDSIPPDQEVSAVWNWRDGADPGG